MHTWEKAVLTAGSSISRGGEFPSVAVAGSQFPRTRVPVTSASSASGLVGQAYHSSDAATAGTGKGLRLVALVTHRHQASSRSL